MVSLTQCSGTFACHEQDACWSYQLIPTCIYTHTSKLEKALCGEGRGDGMELHRASDRMATSEWGAEAPGAQGRAVQAVKQDCGGESRGCPRVRHR